MCGLRQSRDVRRVVVELASRNVFVQAFPILPVQRLRRYLLLLETLVKNTPAQLPEDALLEAVCTELNDELSENEPVSLQQTHWFLDWIVSFLL